LDAIKPNPNKLRRYQEAMNADKRSRGLTDIPEKLLKIADDIAERGNANLIRLTVMKKWFGHPGRLTYYVLVFMRVGSTQISFRNEKVVVF
jgi:hypothetical protein